MGIGSGVGCVFIYSVSQSCLSRGLTWGVGCWCLVPRRSSVSALHLHPQASGLFSHSLHNNLGRSPSLINFLRLPTFASNSTVAHTTKQGDRGRWKGMASCSISLSPEHSLASWARPISTRASRPRSRIATTACVLFLACLEALGSRDCRLLVSLIRRRKSTLSSPKARALTSARDDRSQEAAAWAVHGSSSDNANDTRQTKTKNNQSVISVRKRAHQGLPQHESEVPLLLFSLTPPPKLCRQA